MAEMSMSGESEMTGDPYQDFSRATSLGARSDGGGRAMDESIDGKLEAAVERALNDLAAEGRW